MKKKHVYLVGIGFLVSIGVWVYDVRDTPGIWAVKTWQDWYHIPEQRIKIKTQLDHAEQDLMMIQAVRKDIEHKYQDPQSLIHITPNETLLAYTKKLKELELNMDELGARYNHKHPKWIALKKEYDFFRHNFQAEEDKLREEKKRLQENEILEITQKENAKQDEWTLLRKRADVLFQETPLEKATQYFSILLVLCGMSLFGFWILTFFDRRIFHPKHILKLDPTLAFLMALPKQPRWQRQPLHVHQWPKTHYAQNIFRIRNRLLLKSKKHVQVFCVASIDYKQQDGRFVTNLAIALAQAQRRVLLVECQPDLKRLHQYFSIPEEKGLSKILKNPQITSIVPHKVEVPRLEVLPAGQNLGVEQLCSEAFGQWIESYRQQVDFILLDVPALCIETETLFLFKKADGMLLTVPSGKVTKKTLRWAMHEVKQAGLPLFGVILKEVSRHHAKSWNRSFGAEVAV